MAHSVIQRVCKVAHFTHKNTYLLANLLFVHGIEGDGERRTLVQGTKGSIDASSSSLETPIATHHMLGGMQTGGVSQRQTIACLQIFCCLRAKRGTRQRRPLLQLKTSRLMLPALGWKRPLQLITCKGDANGSSFIAANKYLFDNILFPTIGEGDKATSPSFATENAGIDASSMLLEALIAT